MFTFYCFASTAAATSVTGFPTLQVKGLRTQTFPLNLLIGAAPLPAGAMATFSIT